MAAEYPSPLSDRDILRRGGCYARVETCPKQRRFLLEDDPRPCICIGGNALVDVHVSQCHAARSGGQAADRSAGNRDGKLVVRATSSGARSLPSQ